MGHKPRQKENIQINKTRAYRKAAREVCRRQEEDRGGAELRTLVLRSPHAVFLSWFLLSLLSLRVTVVCVSCI